MAVARRLSSHTSFREENLGSTPQSLSAEAVKLAANRFDTEIVFTLRCADYGTRACIPLSGDCLPITERRSSGFTKMTSLELCPNLVTLDLSRNRISRMEGLDALANLQVLLLASNRIGAVENIGTLSKLQVLNMQDNHLKTIAAINLPLLAQLPLLTTVCFQNIDLTASNPVCQSSGYKENIVQHLPSLRNLDGERSPGSHQYMEIAATIDRIKAEPPLVLEDHLPVVTPLLLPAGEESAYTTHQGPALERADWESKVLAAVDRCVMLNVVLNEKLHRLSSI